MKRILGGLAIAVALALPASAATIVVNGSFEAGVPGNVKGARGAGFSSLPNGARWDVWQALNGWTKVSGPGIEVQTGGTLGNFAAQDGKYYLELDSFGNSAMQQIVSLAKGSYILSFWYSPRINNPASNQIDYSVGNLVSGSVNGPNARLGTALNTWTKISSAFTVEKKGDFALRFGAVGRNDSYGGLIDNVAIEAEPSAVPLPAAGVMLLAALGGLGLLRRRRA